MAQEPLAGFKEQLLGELDTAFAALMDRVRAQPLLAPSNTASWGTFEMLAHLAGWHESAAARLRDIAAGRPVVPPGAADDLNARFVAERAGLPAARLLADVNASFRSMREAARTVPASEFKRGADSEHHSLAYFILWANGPEHYAEHMADLESLAS